MEEGGGGDGEVFGVGAWWRVSVCLNLEWAVGDKPPYASPNTSSPTLNFPFCASAPSSSMTPLNSTPRIKLILGGSGYLPSRWRRSMRFSPKALTRTRASLGEGEGFGTEGLRKRAEAGPLPFFMSGERVSGVR